MVINTAGINRPFDCVRDEIKTAVTAELMKSDSSVP